MIARNGGQDPSPQRAQRTQRKNRGLCVFFVSFVPFVVILEQLQFRRNQPPAAVVVVGDYL
jgi:hypothetical protein